MMAQQQISSLYRRLLRIAASMPDVHRRRLVGYRARQEIEKLLRFNHPSKEWDQQYLDLDILSDNLELQSRHLNNLNEKPQGLMIPVDLRQNAQNTDLKMLDVINRSKLVPPNRFMQGPEPSWISKKPRPGAKKSSK